MIAVLAILTPIALINSVAILPSGIAGVVAALGARKPILTASAFVAGKFVPHFTFGLLLTFGLDAAFDRLGLWTRGAWQDPATPVVVLQLIIGAVMVVFGYRLSRVGQHRPDGASSTPMTPVGAFSVAAGLTLVGLPGAWLYFAAIDQILRSDLMALGIVKAVLYYNVIYLLPLMLIILSRGLLGTRVDPIFRAVARFLERWGKQVMFFGLLGVGVVLAVDAITWFLGFPLLPRYDL
jgi:hypothetical protein